MGSCSAASGSGVWLFARAQKFHACPGRAVLRLRAATGSAWT